MRAARRRRPGLLSTTIGTIIYEQGIQAIARTTLGPRPGNRFNIPNPDLLPEQVITVDAGVKVNFPRFSGELFGFYSDFQDKIESVLTEGKIDGRDVVQSANLNAVTLFGVETGGRFRLLDNLEAFGNLTFIRGEEKLPDARTFPADQIPPLNAQIGLFYRPTPRSWVEPFIQFTAGQDRLSDRDRIDPRINPDGTPGWVTVNFRFGWDINETVRARLALENLFDQDYRMHGSGINAPGINATASLEARF